MGWRSTKAWRTVSRLWPVALAWSAMRGSSEGDSIVPGQIALARMPRLMKSAATAFANWCVRSGRMPSNPFDRMSKANEDALYRTLRALKNRFGSTNEAGVFEMHGGGLVEVADASARFVGEATRAPGSVVLAAMEGSRPLLVEVQTIAAL